MSWVLRVDKVTWAPSSVLIRVRLKMSANLWTSLRFAVLTQACRLLAKFCTLWCGPVFSAMRPPPHHRSLFLTASREVFAAALLSDFDRLCPLDFVWNTYLVRPHAFRLISLLINLKSTGWGLNGICRTLPLYHIMWPNSWSDISSGPQVLPISIGIRLYGACTRGGRNLRGCIRKDDISCFI